jgi:hypothetical protein
MFGGHTRLAYPKVSGVADEIYDVEVLGGW